MFIIEVVNFFCDKCHKNINEDSNYCPFCGSVLNVDVSSSAVESKVDRDKINIWFVILSWFVPLVGVLVFFIKKETAPRTAKASGLCALISFILNLLVIFFMFFVFLNFTTVVYQNDNIKENELDTEEIILDDDYLENDNLYDIDWRKFQVSVNGNDFSLPVDYFEFSGVTGFSLRNSDLSKVSEKGYYQSLNMYQDDKLALYVGVYSDDLSPSNVGSIKVTSINQTKFQINQGVSPVIFPGGLKVGSVITEARLISLFGVPSKIDEYNFDDYSSKTYSYYLDLADTSTNYFRVSVDDGKIINIVLKCEN